MLQTRLIPKQQKWQDTEDIFYAYSMHYLNFFLEALVKSQSVCTWTSVVKVAECYASSILLLYVCTAAHPNSQAARSCYA